MSEYQDTQNDRILDPLEKIERTSEEDLLFDDNFVLDTTQDLPIRKPQSAYVIFGKVVSIF